MEVLIKVIKIDSLISFLPGYHNRQGSAGTPAVLSGGLFYVKRNESRNWCAWGDYNILRLFDRVASPHMPFDMATVGTNIRTGHRRKVSRQCEFKYFLSIYLFGQRQIYWLQEKRF